MEEIKYFFSYARKDSAFVLNLAAELRAAGVNLWLDQLDILGGQRWDRAVEEALETCQGMIIVLSPASLASHNVMDEVSYALEKSKVLVPIVHQPCDIPFRLRRIQHIDFTVSYHTGFSQLLRALHIEQTRETTEPPVLIKHPTRQLPLRLTGTLVGGAIGAIWGMIAALLFDPSATLWLGALLVGICGAITGAMSGGQRIVIATVIGGIIIGASIWAYVEFERSAGILRAAGWGVSFGAIGGAIVGVIIKNWESWPKPNKSAFR